MKKGLASLLLRDKMDVDGIYDCREQEKKLVVLLTANENNPADVEKYIGGVVDYILLLDNAGIRGNTKILEKALRIFHNYHRLVVGENRPKSSEQMYSVAIDVAKIAGLEHLLVDDSADETRIVGSQFIEAGRNI